MILPANTDQNLQIHDTFKLFHTNVSEIQQMALTKHLVQAAI